jgi:photosystem II stability/assembly factor-like uncharacterized protein
MKRCPILWGCFLVAFVGLVATNGVAEAAAPTYRASGAVPPASLGMPLKSVVCSTPRNCVSIGTPINGSTLDPIAVRTTDGGAHWASTRRLRGIKDLDALACGSTQSCLVVGANPQGNDERGASIRTDDGGQKWSVDPALPRAVGELVGLSCPSKTFCMAVGRTASDATAVALTTNNTGRTWSIVAVPKGQEDLDLVSCTTRHFCVAEGDKEAILGDPSGGSRLNIITTSDGGSTWNQRTLLSYHNAPAGIPYFSGLTCVAPATCVLVGVSTVPDGSGSGMIALSTDRGTSWNFQAVPPGTIGLSAVSCGSATRCVVAGGGFGSRGGSIQELLSTNDAGHTWISRTVPPTALGLDGVSCPSATSCVAVGYDYSDSDPTAEPAAVVTSVDGGIIWNSAS